jgi:hypothetical protein
LSTSPQTIIDAIDAAILVMTAGGGAQTLTHEGRSVTYYGLRDLIDARKAFVEIAGTSTDNQRRMIRTQTAHLR